MLQKEAAMTDTVRLPLLVAVWWEVTPGQHWFVTSVCCVAANTQPGGSGGTEQSQVLPMGAGEQPLLRVCLGELPNSQALTCSLRDKKQIQLFYPESGERMCEIKVKTVTLK